MSTSSKSTASQYLDLIQEKIKSLELEAENGTAENGSTENAIKNPDLMKAMKRDQKQLKKREKYVRELINLSHRTRYWKYQ